LQASRRPFTAAYVFEHGFLSASWSNYDALDAAGADHAGTPT